MVEKAPLSEAYLTAYNGDVLIAVTVFFLPLIYLAVGLRFYCHHLNKVKWGVDDYLVLVSLFLQTGAATINFCGVKYAGNGYHLAALEQTNPKAVTAFFKWLLAISSFYFFQVGWPKLAILAFYLRIFTSKIQRGIVWLLIGVVIANGIICPIVALNLCRPFAFNWNRHIPGGHCLKEVVFYRWGSFPNILTDVIILALPMRMVWNLHNSWKIKTGLMFTFILGSIGLTTSILRFDAFFRGNAIEDGTYDISLTIYSVVEPNIYLIAACLLSFRPLYQQILSKAYLLKKLTSPLTGRSTTTSRNIRSAPTFGSGVENSKKFSNGFQKMGKDDIESGYESTTPGSADGDHIQLVYLDKNDLKNGNNAISEAEFEYNPNQIRVRSDYIVRTLSQ